MFGGVSSNDNNDDEEEGDEGYLVVSSISSGCGSHPGGRSRTFDAQWIRNDDRELYYYYYYDDDDDDDGQQRRRRRRNCTVYQNDGPIICRELSRFYSASRYRRCETVLDSHTVRIAVPKTAGS